jgi:putative ABC transport system permease protein
LVDREQPVVDIRTMDEVMAGSMAQKRFTMLLLASFAALALALAAVGIYSMLSYAVRQPVREIGIRLALGAQPGEVLRMIVLSGLRPTLVGVLIGVAGARLYRGCSRAFSTGSAVPTPSHSSALPSS